MKDQLTLNFWSRILFKYSLNGKRRCDERCTQRCNNDYCLSLLDSVDDWLVDQLLVPGEFFPGHFLGDDSAGLRFLGVEVGVGDESFLFSLGLVPGVG